MAAGERGAARGPKQGGESAGKQQSAQGPSEAARAAERASAGIGTDDSTLWEDWFLESPPDGPGRDEHGLLG
jgi:hypothetical protein